MTNYEINNTNYNFSEEVYILGVEADATDGLSDGKHDFHWVDSDPSTFHEATYTQSDTLQISHNGSNTGATGMVGTGKSLVIGTNVSSGLGPTTAGYSTRSEPFAAIDMTTGASVHANLSTAISPSGFSFEYFGSSYTSLWVNEDGILSFNSALADIDDTNIDLSFNANAPGSDLRPTQPVIAALWDDLEVATLHGANGRILYKTGNFDSDGGIHSPEADALRDAVMESIANQILRADAAGDVYSDDLLADGDMDGDGDVDGDDWTLFVTQLGLDFVGWKPLAPRR